MFSPLNNPQVEHWFQRLNAPLKRLPADERAEVHQEVRQHLDALAAANEELGSSPSEASELALQQFGDPSRFGKKMAQEWQQGKPSFQPDMKAILFGSSFQILGGFLIESANRLWFNRFYNPSDSLYTHGRGIFGLPLVASTVIAFGVPLLVGAGVGLKYPLTAIKGAFYAYVLCDLCKWILPALTLLAMHIIFSGPPTPILLRLLVVLMPSWLAIQVTAAYLASATKRGWYRPTLDDFKLTLPRWRQVS